MGPTCKAFNYCAGNECSNHGSCQILRNGYRCNCNGGFIVTDCEFTDHTDHCFGKNCNNRGNCTSDTNTYILVIVMQDILAKIVKLQIIAIRRIAQIVEHAK